MSRAFILRACIPAILIAVLILSATLPALATMPVRPDDVQWSKTYGGEGELYACSSMAKATDGGYVLSGFAMLPDKTMRAYALKVDDNGGMLWSNDFGRSNISWFDRVVQMQDGNYLFAGQTHVADANPAFLVKTDTNGNHVFDKTFGGANNSTQFTGILPEAGGAYLLTGQSLSLINGSIVSGIYVLKIDSYGNELWSGTYGRNGLYRANDIVQAYDGGYAIAGTFNDAAYLLRIDGTGKELWTKLYTDATAVTVCNADDGYLLAGITTMPSGNSSMNLIRIAPDGSVLWNRTSVENAIPLSVSQTPDKGFLVAGQASSGAFVSRFTRDGDMDWMHLAGNSGDSFASAIQASTDAYICAGTTKTANGTRIMLTALGPVKSPNPSPAGELLPLAALSLIVAGLALRSRRH